MERDERKTMKYRPLIQTNVTPRMIIGNDMPLIEDHIKFWNENEFEVEIIRDKKKRNQFKAEELATIAAIYKELQEHGYYYDGHDRFGKVQWCQLVDQQGTKKDYDMLPVGPFSREEIKNMVAEHYRRFDALMDGVKLNDKRFPASR